MKLGSTEEREAEGKESWKKLRLQGKTDAWKQGNKGGGKK
jgi:hypothetical protein